jgi:hypothetical protein
MTVDEFIANPETLRAIYGYIPQVKESVRIRSLNLNWRGPTLIIRVDLPRFPDPAPQDWLATEFDTVQCHLRFLAVQNLSLRSWDPPAWGRIEATPRMGQGLLHIDITGHGMDLAFDCSDSVTVGHVSAFKVGSDGSDQGPHSFASRIDSRRHSSVPETWERSYFERV